MKIKLPILLLQERTLPTQPESPGNLSLRVISERSVFLTWRPAYPHTGTHSCPPTHRYTHPLTGTPSCYSCLHTGTQLSQL